MEKETPAIYLTMNEFEKISPNDIRIEPFITKPDYHTMHKNHFIKGKQIFIKPEGRASWL